MNGSVTRYPNRHRSEPMRETVALWCKSLIYCTLMQREIQHVHFDVACLNDVIIRKFGLIAMSYDGVRTQIPIGWCQQ